jgi:hypothetical protein
MIVRFYVSSNLGVNESHGDHDFNKLGNSLSNVIQIIPIFD